MERHPVTEEGSLQLTRIQLAQLWDQVWWMRLPFWRRWAYRLQGFTDPIEHFYEAD
jgi:hypothetical protein